MKSTQRTFTWEGKEFIATFSDLAHQADSSVMLSCDNTVVFATVCYSSKNPNPGYFNLTVEYLEKNYAVGEILGSQWNKREGRPSTNAVLASRIIDRTIRPLFDNRMQEAVQVVVTVLAVGEFDPVLLATNAASIAIMNSAVPWNGPIAAVSVSHKQPLIADANYTFDINTYCGKKNHSYTPAIDLLVCSKSGEIVMIEADADQLSESIFENGLQTAVSVSQPFESWQRALQSEFGKTKIELSFPELPTELQTLITTTYRDQLIAGFCTNTKELLHTIEDSFAEDVSHYLESHTDLSQKEAAAIKKVASDSVSQMFDEVFVTMGLDRGLRADSRDTTEVRELYAAAGGLSPQLHGTGIFYRGETHVASFITLAGPDAMQEEETIESNTPKRFMHHYNFPPYSVGEVGRFGSTGRREIGHGALVEKAIARVLPSTEVFPYTIRAVSECFGSDGSTSQASICATTLGMMDAGIPITDPVAGISIGVLMNPDKSRHVLLTDIMGIEDHHGSMDYKIAGTARGITAIQLDIKLDSIPVAILIAGLAAAKSAREHILGTILDTIPAPRADLNPTAPRITTIQLEKEKIGMVIGSGGKTIQKIQADTATTISINDDGLCFITGSRDGVAAAHETIATMTRQWMVGDMADAVVVKIIEAGAIVELSPFHDGLVHISELAPWRIEKVSDVVSEGQHVPVVVTAVDPEKNRISLSIKKRDAHFFDAKKPVSE